MRAHSSEPRSQLPASITIQRMLEMPLVPVGLRKNTLYPKRRRKGNNDIERVSGQETYCLN